MVVRIRRNKKLCFFWNPRKMKELKASHREFRQHEGP
jgi:hypothetical protein